MTTTTTRARLDGLDKLRGAALVLMVVDHALVAFPAGGAGLLTRVTITRASLPLFCLVAGSLVRPGVRWRRLGLVGGAGLVAGFVGAPIGIGQPDVLFLLAGSLGLVGSLLALDGRVIGSWWLVLVVAVLQPVTWPIGWTGYEPGAVLALVMVGYLVAPSMIDGLGRHLPGFLAPIGRYPLTLYVGHLAALYVLSKGL